MKKKSEDIQIVGGVCTITDKDGEERNDCKDKPVVTYCSKCNSLYAVNQEDGSRREMSISLKQFVELVAIFEKQIEQQEFDR